MPSKRRGWFSSRAPASVSTETAAGPAVDESALVLRGLSPQQSYRDAPSRTHAIAWSADGSFIAAGGTASGGCEVAIWPAGSDDTHWRRIQGKPGMMGLAWHPQHSLLAFGGSDAEVNIWDAETGGAYYFSDVRSEIRGLAWSPDGGMLAVAYARRIRPESGGIGIWYRTTHEHIKDVRLSRYPNSPRWSLDGESLTIPDGAGTILNLRVGGDWRTHEYRNHHDVIYSWISRLMAN